MRQRDPILTNKKTGCDGSKLSSQLSGSINSKAVQAGSSINPKPISKITKTKRAEGRGLQAQGPKSKFQHHQKIKK
jgi:hypothetical protein